MTQPDGQRFELVITGEVDVIPGPLSKIRAIAEEALADTQGTGSTHPQLAAIIAIIDGNQP
jgi:hypothetical protein